MDKFSKSRFSQKLSQRSLAALLVFSFICTVLGFAVAYNEHRSLSILSDKYLLAVQKLEACEASISELSQKVDSLQTQSYTEPLTHFEENGISDKDETALTSSASDNQQTEPASSETAPQATDSKYYVTQSGSKYHVASCSYLSKSRIPVSAQTIKAKGYTPCSRCIR